MTALRVLVLTNMYPPHHLGGYEQSCRDVVERWRARGHHVEVLTTSMRVPSVADPSEDRALGVRRELGFYWHDYRMIKASFAARVRMERANQRALARALAEVRPDVVSVWHMGAMSLGLLQTITAHDVPMVFVVCDDWLVYGTEADLWTKTFARRPRLGALARRVTGLPTSITLDRDAVAICFVSEWVRQRALERSPFPLERTTVVYSGIDLSDFPLSVEHERPWSWRLLAVGRIEERKGFHVAVEALIHLPEEATLDVIGPARQTYLERLRRSAAQLGVADRVRLIGSIPRHELGEHYRSADAFVFPVQWEEPFGLVPLEAMACGTPVIATGTGGSREFLISGMNCILVAPGDAKDLANAVLRLAADATLRRSLVRAGRATAAQLDVDRLAEVLEPWHLAAAGRFRKGVPEDRPLISEVLEPLTGELDRDA